MVSLSAHHQPFRSLSEERGADLMATKFAPPLVVILCAPRSFSSVVCAMLGQHDRLYGFPELNLFLTDRVGQLLDLDDRVRQTTRHWGIYTVGVARAVAELEFGAQTEESLQQAIDWLQQRRDWPCADLLRHLLARIAPRIGVDKSPRTALSAHSMQRMLNRPMRARCLHLTRHPISCITSMMVSGQVWSRNSAMLEPDTERAAYCASLWCEANERILDLISTDLVLRVRGEHLLAKPDLMLNEIAAWLGLDSDPATLEAMRHPERSPFATPGPWPSWGDQDPGFIASPGLDRTVGQLTTTIPHSWRLAHGLSDRLQALGDRLGYIVDRPDVG
jgi:Sulfotransferase family